MSKTNTNAIDVEAVDCDEEILETLPETEEATEAVKEEAPAEVQNQAKEEAPKKKKKDKALFTRLLGVLLVVLSALPLFLGIQLMNADAEFTSMTLLKALSDVFANGEADKLFGFLPVLAGTATAQATLAGFAFYLLLIGLAVTVVSGVIAAVTGKACALKVASVAFAIGSGANALSSLVPTMIAGQMVLDIISLAMMGIGAVVYLILAFKGNGKKTVMQFIQLILSLVVFAVFVIAFKDYFDAFKSYAEELGVEVKHVANCVFMLASLGIIYDVIRVQIAKPAKVDAVRYMLGMFVAAIVLGAAILANDVVFIVFGAVGFVITVAQALLCYRKKPEEVVEEVVAPSFEEVAKQVPPVEEEPVPEFVVEEYAEAMPYDGGPVEGVELAEEVNPTFDDPAMALPTHVNTAGYDFYNCKSFDPFIAILNTEERNQFTELFILKYKGVMREIPDYVVGGDNREFFRKLFIYLGQYRDRIPDGLLSKIYQFNIKM